MSYSRIFTIIFTLLSLNYIPIITNAAQVPESTLISTDEEDLTGNSQKETIQLKATAFSKKGNYYQDIWLEVTDEYSERWKIPLGGGYEPKVQFLDLNNDRIIDIFYQSKINENDELYSHHLYSLSKGTIKKIPFPEPLYIKGRFNNNFQVEIQISPHHESDKPVVIDIKDQANDYVNIGLYNKNGQILEPTNVTITPIIFFEPMLISKSKGYGLKSYQEIIGVNQKDKLGMIETLWYFENGSWIILQTDGIPSH